MQNKNFWEACVGKTIDDRYSLEKLIGSGSFGGVFQAKMVVLGHTLQKQVAVKLMQDGGVGGMQHCELKSALNLPSHDSLIQHFNWGQVKINDFPMLYLVMELGECCLDSYRKDRQILSSDEVKEIVLSVAEGLCYMHSKVHGVSELTPPEQLTHRDLKPANVIKVGKKWKMADFGFAKSLNKGSVQATLIGGTDRYMPPEIFEKQWISTKGDIWALGVMIVEMLAGHHPIKAPITSTTIQKEPIDLDGVPDEWIEIVNGCLQKDHKERWTAQQILDSIQIMNKKLSVEELINQAFEQRSIYKDYNSAISNYTDVVKLNPSCILAYAERGRTFQLVGDYTSAKEDLEKAINLFPILTAEAYYGRGIAKSYLKDKKGAVEDFTQAIELNPNNSEAYLLRASTLKQLGELDRALSDYDKSLNLNPDSAIAYLGRGLVKYQKGDKQGAISDYSDAISLKPDFFTAYFKRAITNYDLGYKEQALFDYNNAIEYRTDDPFSYFHRGGVKYSLEDRSGAIYDYDKAIELKPDYVDAYFNRAVVKVSLGNKEDAINDYRKVIELKPDYIEAYLNRGAERFELRDYDGSMSDYNTAIEINDEYPLAYRYRWLAKYRLGDKGGALVDCLEEARLYQIQGKIDKYNHSLKCAKQLENQELLTL